MTSEPLSINENPRLQSAARNAPPMFKGERGQAVAILQKAYVEAGYPMPGSIRSDGSADGIFGKETYSVTRHFQIGQGISVDGIVGQNTLGAMSKLLGGTDPGNRPVSPNPNAPVVPVDPGGILPGGPTVPRSPRPSPRPSKRTHFAEGNIATGFDKTATPPWQMVPTSSKPLSSGGGGAIVKLFNGEGLTVTSNNDLIKVHELPISFKDECRRFLLTGEVDGARAMIEARTGSLTVARMEAETTKPYVLTVDFYMVSDKVRKTSRPVSELAKLVNDTSQLLAQQCNIHLKKQYTYPEYKVDADLGEVILVRDMQKRYETQDVYLIFQGCRNTADLNVFCVWEYEMNAENAAKGDVHTGLHFGQGRILIEDDYITDSVNKKVGKWTLMHEAGHALGLKHKDGTIMADIGQTKTSYLRKTQIHKMWKSAGKTAKK
ncbi:peptidoglycan-binding protein [Roseibium album]|uniref:peptidoglycan-binding domain-containing protein n=1 Tax=Roseibium album TaxID=311410 RepID=UPI00391CAA35